MDRLHTILEIIEKRAGKALIYETAYVFTTTQGKFEDVKELLDILNILYDEEYDCCITEIYFSIEGKLIIIQYTHDFEW